MAKRICMRKKSHGRLLVVGDIHGYVDKFENALALADFKSDTDRLVLLGDYVDRGPYSRRVLDKVMGLVSEGAVSLMGNHEKMMLDAMNSVIEGKIDPSAMEQWFANGGEATLRNYRSDREALIEHLDFIKKMPLAHQEDGYVFVHAGVRPGVELKQQRNSDLLWIRDEYFLKYEGPWKIISGHTPTKVLSEAGLVAKEKADQPIVRSHQIFMDTGAAWGGKVTLMDLASGKYWQS